MKKRNLTAAFLACALCVATMTGTACSPQPSLTDEVEPVAVESTTGERPLETEAEDKLDNEVDTAEAQVGETVQAETEAIVETETAASVSPKSEAISEGKADSDSKPTTKAALQPEAKKPAQSSAATPKQGDQPKEVAMDLEPETVTPEVDPNDDEVLFLIDAIPAAEETAAKASTITINGVEMSYVDAYGATTAPDTDAGIWRGSDSTTDGSYGYFIGHDYTDFGDVANLEQGSTVSVTDGNGDSRDYQVVDSFVVPEGSHWSDISSRVTGYGESIVMQTCVDDGYQIVVAE